MHLKGFTLLELLVTLAIAAVVLSVVSSGSSGITNRSQYLQALRDVNTLLKSGKATALQTGSEVPVSFHSETRELSFGNGPRQRVVLPAFVQLRAKPDTNPLFVFRADGTAYGGDLTIAHGSTGVAFRLNWALGFVEQTEVASPQ